LPGVSVDYCRTFSSFQAYENEFQHLPLPEIVGSRHPFIHGNSWELKFMANFEINEIEIQLTATHTVNHVHGAKF
jgi:hypothetical protein